MQKLETLDAVVGTSCNVYFLRTCSLYMQEIPASEVLMRSRRKTIVLRVQV